MSKIVLLVVGAAWAAVLLPPLLRSRVDNRPNSSVVDFRRRLSTLQRTVPARSVSPLRSMARPLVQSPARTGPRTHGGVPGAVRIADVSRPPAAGATVSRLPRSADATVRQHRPVASARRAPVTPSRRTAAARPSTGRERVRQRRQNVLVLLTSVTIALAFLALTTRNSLMVYGCVLAAVSLTGFCYKLVQIRRQEDLRSYGESWFRAA